MPQLRVNIDVDDLELCLLQFTGRGYDVIATG